MKKTKLEMKDLRKGDLLIFVNHAKNKFKILTPVVREDGTVEEHTFGNLLYYRQPMGHMIDPHAFQYIIYSFGGQGFDMGEAIKKAILERFVKKTDEKIRDKKTKS